MHIYRSIHVYNIISYYNKIINDIRLVCNVTRICMLTNCVHTTRVNCDFEYIYIYVYNCFTIIINRIIFNTVVIDQLPYQRETTRNSGSQPCDWKKKTYILLVNIFWELFLELKNDKIKTFSGTFFATILCIRALSIRF